MAGCLGHTLLTGEVRRNICGELAPSLYIETIPFAATSCGGGGFCVHRGGGGLGSALGHRKVCCAGGGGRARERESS